MKFKSIRMALICGLLVTACARAQPTERRQMDQQMLDKFSTHSAEQIRLNQLGFYPDGPKTAIISELTPAATFQILNQNDGKLVYQGKLVTSALPALNGKHTQIADFSSFKQSGRYLLYVEGLGKSYPFLIGPRVYAALGRAAIKAFYYQRASAELVEKNASIWHRKLGHPDDAVRIHPSAASELRPAGMVISASKGWYDAGDYNKYIVNSGVTMGTLLSLYEDFPDFGRSQNLNIPESGNGIPDVLNEVIWNLRWMLAMQDPEDGGVYNKLTNADFDGMVMPNASKTTRYVVQKGTAATLDFAAVAAQAGRILKAYNRQVPGLADSCLKAAVKAWKWAKQYPDIAYNQRQMNQNFKPEIHTGGYGDHNFTDEWIWAAVELQLSTGDSRYYDAISLFPDEAMPLPSWNNVRLMGYYSLIRKQREVKGVALRDLPALKRRVVEMADRFLKDVNQTAYQVPFGKTSAEFGWGSNSMAANQGIALLQAYLLSGDDKYKRAAMADLDYLLGRNASGYAYVTGFGWKSPMHPHHRPSAADGILAPVPGLLVGGPNPGNQDGVALPSKVPDEAYVDHQSSYASNEIAINWNAPLAYLVNAIEVLATAKNSIKTQVK